MNKSFLILLSFLYLSLGFANQARVIEVQVKLKNDASSFLEKFAPGTKYSVKVSVKPLLRKSTSSNNSNQLPFMELQEDSLQDEWDNPESSVYSLINRISEAKITIYIEDKVKISDYSKFKEALLTDINLIPGRDSVEILPISTPVLMKNFQWMEQYEILLIGIILLIAVILGVGLNTIAKRLTTSNLPENTTPSTPNTSPPPMPTTQYAQNSSLNNSQKKSALTGDINLQDPTKISETVSKKIEKILNSELFPTLNDMSLLYELLASDQMSFSYLIFEFPENIQKELYKLGKSNDWYKGFTEIGFPSKNVIITLDKMLRNRTINNSAEFEKLLISIWRLDDKSKNFFKNLSQEESFCILYHLPKDFSIPIARKLFPGSWGFLLDEKSTHTINDPKRIEQLTDLTYNISPLLSYESLTLFKNIEDLIKYLNLSQPNEEKEIYQVINGKHNLEKIRPPFFKFFDLEIEERKKVFKNFTFRQWAIACAKVENNEKGKIYEILDEKEKYLFTNELSSCQEIANDYESVSEERFKISRFIYELYNNNAEIVTENPKSDVELNNVNSINEANSLKKNKAKSSKKNAA